MAGPQRRHQGSVFMAASSLGKWGEEQVTSGPAEAGIYIDRANPWQASGQSWVEVMVRSGREEAVGAIKDLSDEISRFTRDRSDCSSLLSFILHIGLLMPVSKCT